ncbi:hypothetical protein POM88_001391 [Heracleum sosnowskyi]|uniref:Uncharacterized protein n=1 Tax=Heracleum sosnowskyi TaxID=360622 RepID=A0AAD8JFR4_9APIA|nr:hypothetical protein POM88_001391 [Heracleum sosnowskyi]
MHDTHFFFTDETSKIQKELTFCIPRVIYVNPGCEADLDSLVQDTIRLTTSVEETCSELCKKAEPKLIHKDIIRGGPGYWSCEKHIHDISETRNLEDIKLHFWNTRSSSD